MTHLRFGWPCRKKQNAKRRARPSGRETMPGQTEPMFHRAGHAEGDRLAAGGSRALPTTPWSDQVIPGPCLIWPSLVARWNPATSIYRRGRGVLGSEFNARAQTEPERCNQIHGSRQCIAHCLKMPGSLPMTGPCEAPTLSLTEQMTLEPRRVVRKASLMLDPCNPRLETSWPWSRPAA